MNYNHSLCQDVATCLRFDFTFRNMALGACSTFSRIGGMVVPFLIALVSCFIFYRSVLNINSHQPNIYQLTYLFCYESEHDLRSRMNNLSGWKRFRKNSGLTGNKTLIFATDRMQPFIHCSGRSRGGARGARSPPPYLRVWMTGPSTFYRKVWIRHCIELINPTGKQAILSYSWLD